MALVPLFDEFRQCQPTRREEITRILSEVSENGMIRGRVMHSRPTYRITLTHTDMPLDVFQRWETWWEANYNKTVQFTWAVDNQGYEGFCDSSPQIEYQPYKRINVTLTILAKKS